MENQIQLLNVNDVIKIAEEEIKRTSEEAVKAALLDISGKLAYESEKARLLEIKKNELEFYNHKLQCDIEGLKKKNKNSLIISAVLGGAGGVIVSSVLFSFLSTLKQH